MTGQALKQGLITEDAIRETLIKTRGDLFLTASYLDVTPRELDSYLRTSDTLRAFAEIVTEVKTSTEYDRLSAEQFRQQLETRTRTYQVEGLDVIHQLATMPFESAAMAEVKLKAAIQLRGVAGANSGDTTQAMVLAELNQLYQQAAPRIKSIRVSQIEFENDNVL